jgi:hypothetical protein
MKRSSNLPEGQGTATSQKAIPNVGIQSSPNGLTTMMMSILNNLQKD